MLGGHELVGHMANPKTSSPFRCGKQFVKEDPNMKFVRIVASLARFT
jgi:hypothetical protein